MDYIKEVRKFISSQYLYAGIKITAGVIIPAFILYRYNILSVMMAIPLGALCVSLTDSPGPYHHRRNGLIASIIINFFVVLITGWLRTYTAFVFSGIILFGMFFSLIGVYGSRVSTIGLIALLVFIFNIDSHAGKQNVFYIALWFSVGGIWYALFSLLLHKIRPYKLIQQLLGECLIETGNYLHVKASFYEAGANYQLLYNQLMRYQVNIRQYHDDLREMLFKTREVVTESTIKGRILMSMLLDSIDLFERIMTSQQDYEKLHQVFDDTGILQKFHSLIAVLASQLQEIGLAVQSGFSSRQDVDLDALLQDNMNSFLELRKEKLNPDTIENFIMLRQIIYSLQDITERIKRLHISTTYDKRISKEFKRGVDLDKFISHQEIDPKLLLDNLSLKSSHFRHAARVTVALLTGYFISLILPLGHGYWILLTIVTIIKPAYSITRRRNIQRLGGTLLGAAIGFTVLYLTKNTAFLFVFMIFSMVLSYSFIKLNYFVGTLGITLYVLLSFHFLNPAVFTNVLTDRIGDTLIGSVIAYVISAFVLPVWEHEQIDNYIAEALNTNRKYFNAVAQTFTGNSADVTNFKFHRKNAFVALANLSDLFQRMLSEPKSKQKKLEYYHQFVASSHTLTSYIASLSYYAQRTGVKYASPEFVPLVQQVDKQFQIAIDVTADKSPPAALQANVPHPISNRVQQLLELRRKEMAAGNDDGVTSLRKTLSDLKTITNQFELLSTITIDQVRILEKIAA